MVTQTQMHRIEFALKMLRVILIAASVVLLLTAILPEHGVNPDTITVSSQKQPLAGSKTVHHDLSWYAPLWQRDLKQPPMPTQPQPSIQQPRPTGPVPKLIATFVDAGQSYAHLIGQDGNTEMHQVYDTVDQYVVLAIESGRVQLSGRDGALWIEVPAQYGTKK